MDTGDARDVALDTDFAFVAEFTNNRFTTVGISDPTAPVIAATVNRTVGGLLMEVALINDFAFGADVFFVNGVPIVFVGDPANPAPRAILDFRNFRDDNGTGIAVDQRYLYLTAARGITENGVNGNTRLYIGQHRAIEDDLGLPPVVTITSPVAGVDVVEGSALPITVEAIDDVLVVAVDLLLDGAVVATDSSAPYGFSIPVPFGPGPLTIGATATDLGNNIGVALDVGVTVVPDTFPPTIELINPADGEERAEGLTTVTILFSKPLDQATVNAANFQLKNSLGDVIEPVSVSLSNGDRTVLMTYLPLPIGTFDVVIKASAVTDRAGNALGLIDQVSQFILVESRVEWIGGDGFWDQGSNWNTGVPPGPDDRVFIDVVADNITVTHRSGNSVIKSLFSQENLVLSGGTLSLAQASQISNLQLSGGTLSGGGDLTLDAGGVFSWSGGTMAGVGAINIPPTAALNISAAMNLQARTINNSGTTTWIGAGNINSGLGAVFNNLAGATFDIRNNRSFLNNQGGAATQFNNLLDATFQKSTGAGTTTISVAYDNAGTVLNTSDGILTFTNCVGCPP